MLDYVNFWSMNGKMNGMQINPTIDLTKFTANSSEIDVGAEIDRWIANSTARTKVLNLLGSAEYSATCTNFPAPFLWEEKLVASLIATPNVDKCNRRQTRKAKKLGYMLPV
jgi:hypothetical protein